MVLFRFKGRPAQEPLAEAAISHGRRQASTCGPADSRQQLAAASSPATLSSFLDSRVGPAVGGSPFAVLAGGGGLSACHHRASSWSLHATLPLSSCTIGVTSPSADSSCSRHQPGEHINFVTGGSGTSNGLDQWLELRRRQRNRRRWYRRRRHRFLDIARTASRSSRAASLDSLRPRTRPGVMSRSSVSTSPPRAARRRSPPSRHCRCTAQRVRRAARHSPAAGGRDPLAEAGVRGDAASDRAAGGNHRTPPPPGTCRPTHRPRPLEGWRRRRRRIAGQASRRRQRRAGPSYAIPDSRSSVR